MTTFSLRSLLLAAIVLSNCISWTASRHHYTHNVSGHRSRHRRQGAGLFLSGSYVLPGGDGAGWGEWGDLSPCSRTCGGGVASQKRICLQIGADGVPQCTGADTKYISCATQDCPAGSRDFREQQCSEFDDQLFRDVKYRWVPYTQAPNPCELNCMPHGERFYYRHRTKVVDGTRCNDESFDVCVNGTCQPVGCDMMLGSSAREDKCRECRGKGVNCQTTMGVLDTDDLRKGYNDMLLIPEGATNIAIAERAPSRNYLALRARNGTYYLNGEYQIDFPRSLVIAGALWYYERSQQGFAAPDKLRCLGPTNEPLILALLLQDDNVGIDYEYSVPNERAPPKNKQYNWAHEEFTPCSAPCGGGYQTRNVTCRSREELDLVDEALCDKDLKPPTNQTCNTEACEAVWTPGPWGECSKRCGKGGTRSRVVHCTQIISNGYPSIVGDKSCFDILGPKPELHQTCNENATCPIWFTGPWKPCDKLCDEGKQKRQVVCYHKNGSRKEILTDEECEDEKPPTEQSCMLQPCDGVDWVLSEWTGCDSCLSTVRTRSAVCATKAHEVVNDTFCAYHPTPVTQEPCDKTKLPPCDVQWYATQWSKCSVDCGKGVQTRKVFCGLFDGASVMKVDDSRCAGQPKYNDTKDCEVPQDKCPSKWFAGPWTACSKKCGGGDQYRRVMCLHGGKPAKDCDENVVVYSEQSCNTGPCDKDELLVGSSSPPMDDDDYDDCTEEEEEYAEVGLDSDEKPTVDDSTMFSDSPSFGSAWTEGSGMWSSPTAAEHESTFTESDSSLSLEELLTTGTVSGSTDFSGSGDDTTDTTVPDYTGVSSTTELAETGSTNNETDSTATDSTGSSESSKAETESTDTGTTESTVAGSTNNETDSTATEFTGSTESSETETGSTDTKTTESTIAGSTNNETDSTATELTGSTESSETETGSTDTGKTESTIAESTDYEDTEKTNESGSTEAGSVPTTVSGETSETETTGPEGSTHSSERPTDDSKPSTVSGSEPTDLSSSTASEGTTESESTSETAETSASESTVSTESGATEATSLESTTKLETSETEETETTETSATETTETSETGSTDATETGSTDGETGSSKTSETSEIDSTESTVVTAESGVTETTEIEITNATEMTEGTTEATENSSTESTETTEISTTKATETTETGTTEATETTVAGSTETTETTETGSTLATETSETGTTEATETTVAGSTETTEMTEAGSTETTETGSTESTETTETGTTEETETTVTESTEATETTETGSTETTEKYTGSTESTVEAVSGSTETTEEGSTSFEATESSSESSTTEASAGTTRWDLSSTVEVYTTKKARVCKPRSCIRSEFGCCPDKKTPALGPFDDGCPKPETCGESLYGCCPDGVSPAQGPLHRGCPLEPCAETLFGCCTSDNKTAAEGNDQEGCPPPPPACLASEFGCCKDESEAKGPAKEGCPETSTTVTVGTSPTVTEEATEVIEGSSTTSGSTETGESCIESEFGCCFDNETAAAGPGLQGCACDTSQFGCCLDGVASAQGPDFEGCVKSCNTSAFGCCPDGKTPAHGPGHEGCCLLYPYGCCPDNYKPADGPHLEGCGCQNSRFGCCPDNVTVATGPNNKGCGCQYTEHGCCPDRHTDASGPEFEGCMCHTYQFGCCPDGVTTAQGPNGQGCYCQQSQFGCCGDEQTHAKGPNRQGCDCATSKHGCCLDGVSEAKGPKFEGCTDKPLDRQAACSLKFERGPCRNYSVGWFYDTEYGGCSRFWYGGCDGNGNRFSSKEECEDTCVSPPPKEACRLPQIKGACLGYNERWYYDTEREMCSNFIYGGCLGNANNFESRELCQAQCEPERAIDQCSLTIERGSCAGNYLRWGYNKETRSCEQFVWGGCEGNSNRFSTEAACMLRCNPPGEPQLPELCTLPASTGDCYDYREKWYFDTKNQRCGLFYYGGCGGNENRFNSEQECVNRCIPPATPPPSVATTASQPAQGSEFCFMEIDAGPCNQVETKWGYDSSRGKCVSFPYGGCGGNQNNFPTEDHCAYYCKPTQDICQLPMLSGPCDDSVMRWFYDAASDSCSQFTYGGCDGNDNRFETREECENRCKSGQAPSVSTTTTTPKVEKGVLAECVISPELEQCSREAVGEVWYYDRKMGTCKAHENLDTGVECRTTGVFYSQEACERSCGVFQGIDVCQYKMEPGPCTDYRPKYYYNKNTSRCEEFAYGGCFGGANRFSTEQECEQVCMATIDPCTLPAEPGNCVGHMVMWYFHQESDQCYQFIFGGCGGNDNKFETREACEGQCKKKPATAVTTTTSAPIQSTRQPEPEEECRTPESLAPCGSNVTVFYFDEASRRCEAANIGGCGSSLNHYRSEEECERRCGAFRGIDVCRAELDPGPCRAAFPKFYFEAASGSCREFTYGGCQGGPNRFSTVEECEEVCASAGPESPNACTAYTEECTALESTCVYGLKIAMTPEGCSRCECEEPVNCDAQRRECDTLRCQYGIERTASSDGCETCKCMDDPCSRSPCASTERCVVVPSRDPITQDVLYSAQCESNEIVDCDAFVTECARLQCPYGVQRTRVGRCERCSCVREETNCSLLHQECERLKCHYGLNRTMGDDGCERCMCLQPPCHAKICPEGERCVAAPFRDPVTQETRYSANCKTINKPGVCPAAGEPIARSTESACRQECRDDADCRGVLKCCARGCSQLCLAPDAPTTPLPSTTHIPDVPRAPEADTDTRLNRPQIDAAEGGKATLRCYFHGNPPPKITWRFGEITIDGDAGRYRLLSDGALEIISLFRNDSGVYICVAQNDLGSAQQQVTLTVADPVSTPAAIAGPEGPMTGELGRSLVVRCQAYGYPPPTIYWYRGHGGEMVPYSNALYEARGQELQIRRLTMDTLGEYECQAYNGEGSAATWRVVVQAYRPSGETRQSPYLIEREVVVTPRKPTPLLPAPPTTTEKPFFVIPPYIVPVHTSLPATSTVSAGTQLSLPCEVDGYPEPEVRWTKDDTPLAASDRIWTTGSRLTIERAEVNDSGVYSCHAANAYSSHSSAARVTVQEVSIPVNCVDNPTFANCALIVQSRFCVHKYYSKFCCKSCVEAGQLDPRDALMQADQSFFRK